MKKIVLFLLIVSSTYAEDLKLYVGSSIGLYNETFTDNVDAKSSSYDVKFKVGYGNQKGYAIEFSIDYIDNKSKIFSYDDDTKYGFNVELLKAFDWDIYVYPFFKAGFGAGFLDINRVTQKTLNYGSYNLGIGMFIPVDKNFDFEIGYDYKYISYEGIDLIASTNKYKSNFNRAYLGFNVRF